MSESLGRYMRAEIFEQAAIAAKWAESNGFLGAPQRHWLKDHSPETVFTFARGTSENAAAFGRYLLSQYAEMLCVQTEISQLTVLDLLPSIPKSLAVGISQSGQSPDLAAVAGGYRDRGIPVLGIVNDVASPLAALCDSVVDIAVGTERAVAATKSFLAQSLAMLDLVDGLGRHAVVRDKISQAVAHACDHTQSGEIQEIAVAILESFAEHAGLVMTTRGPDFYMAREGALKIVETCGIPVSVFTTADLVHGPVSVVGARTAVVVLVPGGRFREPVLATAEKLLVRTRRLITVGAGTVPGCYLHVPLIEEDPNAFSMALAVWLQRLTLMLATSMGLDPDAPPGLEKVTRTL